MQRVLGEKLGIVISACASKSKKRSSSRENASTNEYPECIHICIEQLKPPPTPLRILFFLKQACKHNCSFTRHCFKAYTKLKKLLNVQCSRKSDIFISSCSGKSEFFRVHRKHYESLPTSNHQSSQILLKLFSHHWNP